MSQEILDKIEYLCRQISQVEWSGVLFYSVKGSIKKPETFKVILEDILPLDKGSQTFTSYKLDDRFVDYLMEEPETRMSWKVGHIHSHNTMRVFFSGTDTLELSDNCPQHDYYLSLIVNNYSEFIAQIAIEGVATVQKSNVPFLARDEKGKQYAFETIDMEHIARNMYIYNTIIHSPAKEVNVPGDFLSKVQDLVTPPKVTSITPVTQTPIVKALPASPLSTTNAPAKTNSSMIHTAQFMSNTKDKEAFVKEFSKNFTFGSHTFFSEEELLEGFAIQLFSGAMSTEQPEEFLSDVLDALFIMEVEPVEIATKIAEDYAKVYELHFPDATSNKDFIYYTEALIDQLRFETTYEDIINPTIALLKAMIKAFKEYGTTV